MQFSQVNWLIKIVEFDLVFWFYSNFFVKISTILIRLIYLMANLIDWQINS